ncbi:3-hydroxy-3-methylglutaryl-coenzyme A reductase-like [Rosa chinensis]|uniref:3-hydroxy-3-methylglutaryl-coenzyme A reductase-like n=1 Tax=Rosa chinensis TaxID=74649 RepID=UPI001AD8A794|nr:3-hydroxy-3-methylglutaryl-coenzyme A reductase-like [Rosa chinensis]
MGAKARVAKKTRNPDLLREVGKYSRSKRCHKRGLWAIKAKNGDVFPCHNTKAAVEIMKEILQQIVGLKPPFDISKSTAVFDEKPAMETLAPTTEDEEIIKVVVAGTIPSYSVESKLGDCKRVASIRCKSLEGFD